MKKTMMLALAALLSLSLMACGGDKKEESSTAPESTREAAPEEAETPEETGEEAAAAGADSAVSTSVDIPDEYKEWVPSFATETFLQEVEGHTGVGYFSGENLENTKKFYQDKLSSAGYTEVLNQDQEAGWMYAGMMDDNTSLSILVVESQGQTVGTVAIVSAENIG